MAKRKKKNGWKRAFFILLILIVLFFVWALWDDSEDAVSVDHKTGEQTVNLEKITVDNVVRTERNELKGNGEDTVTVLMYVNGSDLETLSGEATEDLSEIIAAGTSSKVNFLVQTMNTKKWESKLGISSKRTQRYKVSNGGLTLLDDNLGQLNCASKDTLRDFIKWGTSSFPADRYILLFWNHGGGPVYGYGYDDITESEDSLSTDEVQAALKEAGVFFDFIGMDCCLMSCMEFCCAVFDYTDYCILSEDFESGYGWNYTNWVRTLNNNTSIPTLELGKIIVDDMVEANRTYGEDAILAVVDENYMKVLYSNWVNFAYANESSLLGTNYSRKMTRRSGGRVHPILEKKGFFSGFGFGWDDEEEDYELSDYYVSDIMELAGNIESEESAALKASVNQALAYVGTYGESSKLTGISVTLPYGDSEFYRDMKTVFLNCGFDENYVGWLERFTSSSASSSDFYDYDDWDNSWDGWDSYEDDYDWNSWGYDNFDCYGYGYDGYYDDYDDDYYCYDDDYCYDYWDFGWSDEDYYYEDDSWFDWLDWLFW